MGMATNCYDIGSNTFDTFDTCYFNKSKYDKKEQDECNHDYALYDNYDAFILNEEIHAPGTFEDCELYKFKYCPKCGKQMTKGEGC